MAGHPVAAATAPAACLWRASTSQAVLAAQPDLASAEIVPTRTIALVDSALLDSPFRGTTDGAELVTLIDTGGVFPADARGADQPRGRAVSTGLAVDSAGVVVTSGEAIARLFSAAAPAARRACAGRRHANTDPAVRALVPCSESRPAVIVRDALVVRTPAVRSETTTYEEGECQADGQCRVGSFHLHFRTSGISRLALAAYPIRPAR